jgi:hypothetical protein
MFSGIDKEYFFTVDDDDAADGAAAAAPVVLPDLFEKPKPKIKLYTWAVQMIQYAGGRAGII